MKTSELKKLVNVAPRCGYNQANKNEFRRLAMKVLRELRETLNHPPGTFNADIRYNAGGIAVSGEATMHGQAIYVQISGGSCTDLGILYRTCKGLRDFSGGPNNWFSFERLISEGVAGLAGTVQSLMDREAIKTAPIEDESGPRQDTERAILRLANEPEAVDFRIQNEGSIVLLIPVSDAAKSWAEEHIGQDNGYQGLWPTVVIEPRYVADILMGIESDGLVVL